MFKKILIANRGEIALRVICACKELGIETVAVYSEADQQSLHVRFADQAVCIGPPRSSDSYLNLASLISAAEITNAEAVHPGYGFLSESAHFAEVCQASKIAFIGPRPDVLRLMGDKNAARKKMAELGLPVLPGSGVLASSVEALEAAGKIGYPVMVKAAAGGGGRGMRVVASAEELPQAFDTAQQEAQAAFGAADVYVEKCVASPRHIEFQVLADQYGKVVHLGERECTIQRRHQKVVEESPSTQVNAELRRALGHRVVEALQQVGYTNAGTVEFIMDEDHHLYFLEMNARIQVEHPVTEAVTRVDLVAEQIAIGDGRGLRLRQNEVRFEGCALECRINAEDPARDFQPSPGTVRVAVWPAGESIRVDTHIVSGSNIPPFYDSLLAKIIAHGPDRSVALSRMRQAIRGTHIEGVTTNVAFHAEVLADPEFERGGVETSFLARFLERRPLPLET